MAFSRDLISRIRNTSILGRVQLVLIVIWLFANIMFDNVEFEQIVLLITFSLHILQRLIPRLFGEPENPTTPLLVLGLLALLAVVWYFNPTINILSPLITGVSMLYVISSTRPLDDPVLVTILDRLSEASATKKWRQNYEARLLESSDIYIAPRWNYTKSDVETLKQLPPSGDNKITTDQLSDLVLSDGENLLILSSGGGGKTLTLLNVMFRILDRRKIAEEPKSVPVPLYFHLSTWVKSVKRISGKRLTIYEWLIDRLREDYILDVQQAAHLLSGRNILVMLDGLDEMTSDDTTECIRQINDFIKNTGGDVIRPQMLVCCRTDEYRAAIRTSGGKKLRLDRAIEIKPFSKLQILEYVQRYRTELELQKDQIYKVQQLIVLERKLAEILPEQIHDSRSDAQTSFEAQSKQTDVGNDLYNVLSSPLLINSLLRSNINIEDLPEGDSKKLRKYILSRFVEYALHRPNDVQDDLDEDLIHSRRDQLAWLASKLDKSNVFYIEDMQPDWLNGFVWRGVYVFLSRLYIAMVVALAVGLLLNEPFETMSLAVPAALMVTIIHVISLNRNTVSSSEMLPAKRKGSIIFFSISFVLLFVSLV